MRNLLLLALLGATSAWATSSDEGLQIFGNRCSNCHSANQPPRPGAKAKPRPTKLRAPDLVDVQRTADFDRIGKWLEGAGKVKPGTLCRANGLTPREQESLISWMVSIRYPEPLPLPERQMESLKASIAAEKLPPGGGTPVPTETYRKGK